MFKLRSVFPPPAPAQVCLGTRGWFGLARLNLPLAEWRTHLYVVGASGTGKSKYLQHLLFHLITAGYGCGVIDPHSDLANDLIAHLASYPKHRPWLSQPANRERVIYLDPARSDLVVPVNLLRQAYATPYQIAEQIVEAFKRVWPETVGEGRAPRFAEILRNALLVLAVRGLTLLELAPFLTQAAYRAQLLVNFPDAQVSAFFAHQYDRWGREQVLMAAPVLNKVSAFLFQPSVRLSLGAIDNRLDWRRIMDGGQILVVDLGGLTGETQQLYGSLLVEQAALSRREQAAEQRRPFVCMIDEFPNFMTRDAGTLARILSEVRKFNVFLGLAHQTIAQTDGRMQGALENALLKVVFASGRQTAAALAPALFQPQPDAVKHVVEDAAAQTRSHPLFETLPTQLEMAVQRILGLKRRQALVQLPETQGVVEVTTPTVPPARLASARLTHIKRCLARQGGHPAPQIAQQIARRGQSRAAPLRAQAAATGAWQEALWQPSAPSADGRGAGGPRLDDAARRRLLRISAVRHSPSRV
jgi:hypothetical protein